jgi:RHS repeat-associated protein
VQSVRYVYDSQDRWIGRVFDADGDGPAEAQASFFVYDIGTPERRVTPDPAASPGQMLLELDAQGNVMHRYLWGPAVDQILADEQLQADGTSDMLWPLTDHLGTVRDLARYNPASGQTTIVNHITYDAFGRMTGQSDPAVTTLFAFTGRPLDPATGLQNHLHRWYDPSVGRWLSEDPLGFAAGDANLYRYVGNSPANVTDPSGLSKVTVIIKQGGRIVKTLRMGTEEVIRYLRNKLGKQEARRIFVQASHPASVAEQVSPIGKAVRHARDAQGHPAHYHPVIGQSAAGNPIIRNTPHVSDQYTGNAAVIPLLVAGAREAKEVIIALTPAGDIRTIVVEGPELAAALGETLQILQAEAARDAYLRSTTGASNMFRAIDPKLPAPAQGGFPTRAGDWRKPGFWLGGG